MLTFVLSLCANAKELILLNLVQKKNALFYEKITNTSVEMQTTKRIEITCK